CILPLLQTHPARCVRACVGVGHPAIATVGIALLRFAAIDRRTTEHRVAGVRIVQTRFDLAAAFRTVAVAARAARVLVRTHERWRWWRRLPERREPGRRGRGIA